MTKEKKTWLEAQKLKRKGIMVLLPNLHKAKTDFAEVSCLSALLKGFIECSLTSNDLLSPTLSELESWSQLWVVLGSCKHKEMLLFQLLETKNNGSYDFLLIERNMCFLSADKEPSDTKPCWRNICVF